jgi:acyl-CoA dehydrogenase
VIGFSLSGDLLEIQARTRRFAQEEILPITAEYDGFAEVPAPITERGRAAGLLNITILKEYGGKSMVSARQLGRQA